MVLHVLEEDHNEASYVKESPSRFQFLKRSNSIYCNITSSLCNLEQATLPLWVFRVNTEVSPL